MHVSNSKFIFVTGGVLSSLGKGVASASIGALLEGLGLSITLQKLDPYLNVDPGTMNPYQHGEVFVTEDGAETDLDLGHYERFTNTNLSKLNNITAGKIYNSVLEKERKGAYLGSTVQVIPHVTDEIKSMILKASKDKDIAIVEIGGTVGDIESLPFLEAIRQVATDIGKENVLYVHVTLVPYLSKSGELKTKPTQHSVKELRSIGIQPDIIVCRTEKPLSPELKAKIALFCNLKPEYVIQNIDAESLYEVPLMLEEEGLGEIICEKLGFACTKPDLSDWIEIVNKEKNLKKTVNIALVGKYVELHDAYLSVAEALKHAGIANDSHVEILWINAEHVTYENAHELLKEADGILVPGGFGDRGIEGKIAAIKYARENKIPFFGICLGMQCAVIEFARNVLGLEKANSTEFDENTPYPVIDIMPEQKEIFTKGGTMRLGLYPCKLEEGTLAHRIYNDELVYERHRHRYEFNNEFKERFRQAGMVFSGISPDRRLVEIIELKDHPWFVGVQFHPEFKSRPQKPHPIFTDFIRASLENRSKKEGTRS